MTHAKLSGFLRDGTLSTSDNLMVPLRIARRFLGAIQRFPSSVFHAPSGEMVSLDGAKALVEKDVIEQFLHLSPDDLSSVDIGLLWGVVGQCSQWHLIDELLRRLPLHRTISLQDHQEYREVVQMLTSSSHTSFMPSTSPPSPSSSPPSSAANVPHKQTIIEAVLGADDVWRRSKEGLLHACKQLQDSGGDVFRERQRNAAAWLYVSIGTTLQHWPTTADMSFSSAEWQSLIAPSTHPINTMQVSTLLQLTLRILTLHHPSVPAYIQEAFTTAVVQDLVRMYARQEMDHILPFYIFMLPNLITANPTLPVAALLYGYHQKAVEQLTSPVGSHGQPPSSLSLSATLCILLGNCYLEPTPASLDTTTAVPLLRHLNQNIRREMEQAARTSPIVGGLPLALRQRWNVQMSAGLAIVLEKITAAAGSRHDVGNAALLAARSEGCELLQRLLSGDVLRDSASSRVVAFLLSEAPHLLQDIGSLIDCWAVAEEYRNNGFSRDTLALLRRRCGAELAVADPTARQNEVAMTPLAHRFAMLQDAERELPFRNW